MSELHTVKTAIHELTHALLHSDKNIGKNSYVKETEALYSCFYNIDLLNYFP